MLRFCKRAFCGSVLPLVLAGFLFPACTVSQVDFAPRDFDGAESPDGYPAMTYQLDAEDGSSSELRVWSAGAERRGSDDAGVLRIGFEMQNRFDAPMHLDLTATRLIKLDADGLIVEELGEGRSKGDLEVPPGGVGVVGLTFDLPPDVSPGDLRSFYLNWRVDAPRPFEEHTPFRRAPIRDARPAVWRFGYPLYWGARNRNAYRYGLGLGLAGSFYCW